MQGTHPLAGESLHLFQHIRPMLRPFPLYHFHCNSWQGIFDVTLLLQDRMSALIKPKTCIGDQTDLHFIWIIRSDVYVANSLNITLTFDNSCMAHSFSCTFSCCCMLFHLNLRGNQALSQIHASSIMQLLMTSDLWRSRHTHLMTCSRICKPKCLTTAGWALSANCKPHGTQKALVSLNSSQNCCEKTMLVMLQKRHMKSSLRLLQVITNGKYDGIHASCQR